MLKDMRIALQLEQEVGVPAPLGQAAVAAWAAAAEDLPAAADHTEIARWLAAQIDQSRESERPLPIAGSRSGTLRHFALNGRPRQSAPGSSTRTSEQPSGAWSICRLVSPIMGAKFAATIHELAGQASEPAINRGS
jgi:hypothetical protein